MRLVSIEEQEYLSAGYDQGGCWWWKPKILGSDLNCGVERMQQTVMHHRPLVLKVIVSVSSSSSSSCLSVSLRSFEDYAKFFSSFKGGSPSETAISPTTVLLLHFKYCRSGNDSTCNGGRRAHVVEESGRSAMYTHRDGTPPSTLTPLFCSPAPHCARITTDFLYKESDLQLSTRKKKLF
jgi:hypothetical protein